MIPSDDRVVHCLDASGKPYVVPLAQVDMATGRPRCLIRCHDGTEHRLADREDRVRLGLPGISLAELDCFSPVLTGEAYRRAFIASRGSAYLRSPRWKKVEPLGPG